MTLKRRTKDLQGIRFGTLTALYCTRYVPSGRSNLAIWVCECDCGNLKEVRGADFSRGRYKSCGCNNPYKRSYIIGNKYNRWTVISTTDGANGRTRHVCQCECGTIRSVYTNHLVSGQSKSCGCYEVDNPSAITHGLSKINEYSIWGDMIMRCENPNDTAYHRYGGRGIFVSMRWRNFEFFYSDMGPRPSKKHSLDRVNNDGPYAWWNCRWATKLQQANNTSKNKYISFNGKVKSLSSWCRELNVCYSMVLNRLNYGWDISLALTEPPKTRNPRV